MVKIEVGPELKQVEQKPRRRKAHESDLASSIKVMEVPEMEQAVKKIAEPN